MKKSIHTSLSSIYKALRILHTNAQRAAVSTQRNSSFRPLQRGDLASHTKVKHHWQPVDGNRQDEAQESLNLCSSQPLWLLIAFLFRVNQTGFKEAIESICSLEANLTLKDPTDRGLI